MQQPQQPQYTQEQMAQMRQEYVNSLAPQYQLTDEQAAALVTAPNTVLPQLAANLEANVVDRMSAMFGQIIQQHVPQMINQVVEQRQAGEQGETEFFSQWEELLPHKEQVMQIANTYRQFNPQVSKEEAFKAIGMQAWMMLGLDVGVLAAKMGGQQAPAVPQAEPPAPSPVGYTPAAPTPPSAPAPADPNPLTSYFTEIGEDYR